MGNVKLRANKLTRSGMALLTLSTLTACSGVNRDQGLLLDPRLSSLYGRPAINYPTNNPLNPATNPGTVYPATSPFNRGQFGPNQVASPSFNTQYQNQRRNMVPLDGTNAPKAPVPPGGPAAPQNPVPAAATGSKVGDSVIVSQDGSDKLDLSSPSTWEQICSAAKAQAKPAKKASFEKIGPKDHISNGCKMALKEAGYLEAADLQTELGFKVGVYKMDSDQLNSVIEEQLKGYDEGAEKEAIKKAFNMDEGKHLSFFSKERKDNLNTALGLMMALQADDTASLSDLPIFQKLIKALGQTVSMFDEVSQTPKFEPVNIGRKDLFFDPQNQNLTMAGISGVNEKLNSFATNDEFVAVAEGKVKMENPEQIRLFNLRQGGVLSPAAGIYAVFDQGRLRAHSLSFAKSDGVPQEVLNLLKKVPPANPSFTLEAEVEHHIVIIMAIKNSQAILQNAFGDTIAYRDGDRDSWKLLSQPMSKVYDGNDSIFDNTKPATPSNPAHPTVAGGRSRRHNPPTPPSAEASGSGSADDGEASDGTDVNYEPTGKVVE